MIKTVQYFVRHVPFDDDDYTVFKEEKNDKYKN
jgi:hypothetical protein